MKIAFFNCQMRSVPPKKSGGIEKMMHYLIEGFLERGHKVTLFGPKDSTQKGVNLISIYDTELESLDMDSIEKNRMNDQRTLELGKILIEKQYEFDIINNFCLESALPVLRHVKVPLVSRISGDIDDAAIARLTPYKDLNFIVQTQLQRVKFPSLNCTAVINNGFDIKTIPFSDYHKDYLLFIGRISQQKRPDIAIEVARRLKKKLFILGNYKDQHIEKEYFENIFLPALKANQDYVEWKGEVTEKEVYEFSKYALATLFPVDFDEPFGNASVEAMATGSPVIAFNRGNYRETVVKNVTGFLANNVDEMTEAVARAATLDRKACRDYVATKFSVDRMIENYLTAYKELIDEKLFPSTANFTMLPNVI